MAIWLLEIASHGSVQRIAFETEEAAQAELDKVAPKLGRDYFGRNEEAGASHIIKGASGSVAVALNKINSISLVDEERWYALTAASRESARDEQIAFEKRKAAALAERGAA